MRQLVETGSVVAGVVDEVLLVVVAPAVVRGVVFLLQSTFAGQSQSFVFVLNTSPLPQVRR